jgi:hypothetical protein
MKVLMLKSVVDGRETHIRGTIVEVNPDIAKHYLAVGVAEKPEEKQIIKHEKASFETKEHKAPKNRSTKKK